jgi:ribosomal protein S18 acetylase RimI-like enzyme
MKQIRKLTHNDVVSYKDVRLTSLETDPDAYFVQLQHAKQWTERQFLAEMGGHNATIFGYYGFFDQDKLVGYICLSQSPFSVQSHIVDIFNLYVLPSHRRRGIANTLLKHVIDVTKGVRTIESLFLSVIESNTPAIRLYAEFGFEQYGVKKRSIKKGRRYLHEILMRYDII